MYIRKYACPSFYHHRFEIMLQLSHIAMNTRTNQHHVCLRISLFLFYYSPYWHIFSTLVCKHIRHLINHRSIIVIAVWGPWTSNARSLCKHTFHRALWQRTFKYEYHGLNRYAIMRAAHSTSSQTIKIILFLIAFPWMLFK